MNIASTGVLVISFINIFLVYRLWSQVLAFDRDDGENSEIVYSLLQGNWSSLFQVHPSTGVVYAPPNLDPAHSYHLTVSPNLDPPHSYHLSVRSHQKCDYLATGSHYGYSCFNLHRDIDYQFLRFCNECSFVIISISATIFFSSILFFINIINRC